MTKAWLEVSRRGQTWRVFLKVSAAQGEDENMVAITTTQLFTCKGEGAEHKAINFANDVKKSLLTEAVTVEG